MDEKTLKTLEYPKVLEKLAGYAAFSASAEMARVLRPTRKIEEAQARLARTTEARKLLSVNDNVNVGGTRDIRPLADLARRSGVLEPTDLLSIKTTLIVGRDLGRSFERRQQEYPQLTQIAVNFPPPPGIIEGISRCISERAEIMDSASDKLGSIRREMKVAHERLLSRLERLINDPKNGPMLQEAIITQRAGRYVIPLRADFKGQIKSIVHDQSSSGATLFVEPLAVVELNNTWQELQLAERDEERRILAELSDLVGKNADAVHRLTDALAEFDLALMCAKFAEDLHASEPILVPFQPRSGTKHPGSTIQLYYARHPLLDQNTVVPIEVLLDDKTYALVITGPNTGGKTVTLKTIGLMALMAQSGLHIPAQSGSTLSIFSNIYADIGDEQSIEQSLSTFSGHISNIVRILKRADRTSLVLFDELGSGTDPQEGSALARAILAHLLRRSITSLVATHYPELKAFAHATPGVINASMEFDLKTLRPTYHLIIGLPGRSNALAIAERLGLWPDIIQDARTMIDPDELKAEDLLDEIHRQRDLARKAREDAEKAKQEAEKIRVDLARRLEKLEDERRELLGKARAEAEEEVGGIRAELDDVRKALIRARQPVEALKPLVEKMEELEEQASAPVERRDTTPAAASGPRPLRLGDRVHLRNLKLDGIVTAIGESEVEVQVGNLRLRTRLVEISRGGAVEEPAPARPGSRKSVAKPAEPTGKSSTPGAFHPSPGMELDLRGQMAEEALEALESYIENAYLAGMPFVRIIHGKGTGKLRQVIRQALRSSQHVKGWEAGKENEGGDGVTIAHMATE